MSVIKVLSPLDHISLPWEESFTQAKEKVKGQTREMRDAKSDESLGLLKLHSV